MKETTLGLRIDVDTFRGTRLGVPHLCRLLAANSVKATFFFSVGPDNMGRHIYRLFRPAFLKKMLRSKAPALYGWDIILRGLLWPGPVIGEKLGTHIQAVREQGHEIGLHAWDHHDWQQRVDRMGIAQIDDHLRKGFDLLAHVSGAPPMCSAAPAWRCTDSVIAAKEKYPFQYNSDCRGESVFKPMVGVRTATQPQIPTTLPTYDEVIGKNHMSEEGYNEYILSRIRPGQLNVLTIHAEVEGIYCRALFRRFIQTARNRNIDIVPLGALLSRPLSNDKSTISRCEVPGRDGWVSCQTGNN